jgi:regulator of sigma E protease
MALLAIVIFVVLLLALVLVHEFGHFIVAKRAGCGVEEFGFGFPPRLWSRVWHGTRFSFNLIPLGGFVKIEGEDMADTSPGPTSFASKSAGWRIAILSAGVAMNVVLAYVLLTAQSIVGTPILVTDANSAALTDQQVYVMDIAPASPAEQAGLKQLDRIVRINDRQHPSIEQVQQLVASGQGAPVTLEIERQGGGATLTLTPRVNPPAGEGPLGVSLAAAGLQQHPWWQAPWQGLKRTGELLGAIVTQFFQITKKLVTEGTTGGELTGPVGIAIYTNEAAQLGASYVLEFAAIISLNLALINILPLPALDGGRIVFVLLEKIKGRRLPLRFESMTHNIGFVLLIFLMLLITFRDIKRFF